MPDFKKAQSETLVKWGKILTGIDKVGELIDQSCEFCYQYRSNEDDCPALKICGACTGGYEPPETLWITIVKQQRTLRASVEELIFHIGKLKPSES